VSARIRRAEEWNVVGYVTVGTNDLEKAVGFYTTLLALLDAKEVMNLGQMVMFGRELGDGMLAVCTPYDKEPAAVGNGHMVALNVSSKENVDKIHSLALELGGTDEGAVGDRMPGFYVGYFRDLDGNKLAAYCMGT
jgi:catechol 2,3-dioxygenase-like lactoylglutathione lyase family enzyme